MNFSAAAAEIGTIINELNEFKSIIKGRDLDSIWSGSAHDNLTSNLKDCLSKVDKQISYLNSYKSALLKAQEYKENKEKVDEYTSARSRLSGSDENYSSNYSYYSNLINTHADKKNAAKKAANDALSGIGAISSDTEKIIYTVDKSYISYIGDVDSLLALFKSGNLKKMSDSDSLYNYYSEAEVDNMLSQIKSKYSGRNAAVNSVIGIVSMAADVGKKLDYDWGGGHSTITDVDHVAAGVDCSAFASWAVNQGATTTFNTAATGGLVSRGTKEDYSDAKPGDILVYNSGGSGHAIFILKNDVDNGRFICAEAAGSDNGVVVSERNYSSLRGDGYSARDLSEYYD